eukprot:UN02665
MAAIEFVDESYSPSSLKKFEDMYKLLPGVVKVEGYNDPSKAGTEATLDIEYIMAIGQGVPAEFIGIPNPTNTPFIDWIIQEAGNPTTPWVQSVSWGTEEYQYFEAGNLPRMNSELMKLGLRGVTVVVATGDNCAT